MNAIPQRARARAAGLLLGYAADRLMGDPHRWHPVSGFGSTSVALEKWTYRDTRAAGVLHVTVLVGGVAAVGALGTRVARRHPLGEALAVAVASWVVLGGTSLGATGAEMARRLDSGDLAAARELLPSLCGRDPHFLDVNGLARAALESVAENTSDAAVAALLWGAVAGVPGLFVYRAANTLDAMIGYRSEKYSRFGWAAARWDDAVNLVPARVTGLLTAVVSPVVGGMPATALRAWRRDAGAHPSPNAGVVEATAAGALGISLGGRTQYAHGVEIRPQLGLGPAPSAGDLRRAVRLSAAVQAVAAAVSAVLAVSIGKLGLLRRLRR